MVILAYVSVGGSSGNTFAVGEVDIMVGNGSYYNGVFSAETSWSVSDLTAEKFFDFSDMRPGDYGEDSISIEVLLEDTYLCAEVTLTSNNENGCNEPEALEDSSCGSPGVGEGELADLMEFIFWADDGDSVLEHDEPIIAGGAMGDLGLGVPLPVTLADSGTNIWTGVGGPLPEDSVVSIGKAWCYGSIIPQPLLQDGDTDAWSPADDNDANTIAGESADGGFVCVGSTLDNQTQTDSVTGDASFNAVQAFGNEGYLCSDGEPL